MARKAAKEARPKDEGEDSQPAGFKKSWLRENFESIVLAVLFALFVRTFIAQPYKIPSGSMEDNLLVGDHLVVNKVELGDGASEEGPGLLPTRPVRRGDVVIFRPPPVRGITDESTDFIKRVIGLPGEELRIDYDPERSGVSVFVNGKRLEENWRRGHFAPPHEDPGAKWTVTFDGSPPELNPAWRSRTFTLGPREYFMMGDNRNDSADSRFWRDSYAVNADRIRGVAWFVYWSYDVGEGIDPEPKGLGRQVAHYAKIAVHFFTRSRWSRTFQPIR